MSQTVHKLSQSPHVSAFGTLRFGARLWEAGWRAAGPAGALRALAAGARALPHVGGEGPAALAAPHDADPFFAIAHRHYLARSLTMPERVDALRDHLLALQASGLDREQPALTSACGLVLWSADVDDRHYTIALRSSDEVPHEGPLSIELRLGDRRLHTLSFSFVGRRIIDPRAAGRMPVAWLTRNQSAGAATPAARQFALDFRHQSPAYFCMAALVGALPAFGLREAAGIPPRDQVAYDEAHAPGFERSYAAFWSTFGGEAWSARAMRIDLPARLTPVEAVPAKHRARARARRAHWDGIATSAHAALAHRVQPVGALAPAAAAAGVTPRRRQRMLTAALLGLLSALALNWAVAP